MAVVNVRDAVTEAVLSMGASLLAGCAEYKEQVAVAQRQIAAMENAAGGAAAGKSALKGNPKYVSCVNLRRVAAEDLEVYWQLSSTIFNSVLVHRLKDFQESVRVVAVRSLRAFLLFDPKNSLRLEYLKYVGFSCSDYADSVRLEAVRIVAALLREERLAPQLQQFVEHFMERFVEIASLDTDPAVSLAMVQAFRSMQR